MKNQTPTTIDLLEKIESNTRRTAKNVAFISIIIGVGIAISLFAGFANQLP